MGEFVEKIKMMDSINTDILNNFFTFFGGILRIEVLSLHSD